MEKITLSQCCGLFLCVSVLLKYTEKKKTSDVFGCDYFLSHIFTSN